MKTLYLFLLLILPTYIYSAPKTVLNYFQVFSKDGAEEVLKIESQDLKNGYIKFSPLQAEGFGEFVIWKRKDGQILAGITNFSCGPICGLSSIRFYLFPKNSLQYKEITTEVFSETEMNRVFDKKISEMKGKKLSDEYTLWLYLPKKGKNIEFGVMMDQTGTEKFIPLGVANFDGTGFKIKEKR
jgi:hypothetical protein